MATKSIVENLYCPTCKGRTGCRNPKTPIVNGNLYRTRFCRKCDERFVTIEVRMEELYSLLEPQKKQYKNAVLCCGQKTAVAESFYRNDGLMKLRKRVCAVCKGYYFTVEMRAEQCEHTAEHILNRCRSVAYN